MTDLLFLESLEWGLSKVSLYSQNNNNNNNNNEIIVSTAIDCPLESPLFSAIRLCCKVSFPGYSAIDFRYVNLRR